MGQDETNFAKFNNLTALNKATWKSITSNQISVVSKYRKWTKLSLKYIELLIPRATIKFNEDIFINLYKK